MKWTGPPVSEVRIGSVRWYRGKTAYWARPRVGLPPRWAFLNKLMPDVDIGVVTDIDRNQATVLWRVAGQVRMPLYLLRDPHEELATSVVEGAKYGEWG